MLGNLFNLDGAPRLHEPGTEPPNLSPNTIVENIEFRHPKWPSTLKRIKMVNFRNVGLSKTTLERLTFTKCTFEDCLFIGTRFIDVEFHGCTFRDCTFYKARFENVYVDPVCIKLGSKYRTEGANIGVSVFQALLNNFDEDRQDEFFASADMQFRRWKRYQITYDLKNGHIGWWSAHWKRLCSVTYELLAGFGYKPLRFFGATIGLFMAVSWLNWHLIGSSLLINSRPTNDPAFSDAVYYTFSVLTVLGFSTITPVTAAAKLLTVGEALAAVGWLGIFTSLLVKRFLR